MQNLFRAKPPERRRPARIGQSERERLAACSARESKARNQKVARPAKGERPQSNNAPPRVRARRPRPDQVPSFFPNAKGLEQRKQFPKQAQINANLHPMCCHIRPGTAPRHWHLAVGRRRVVGGRMPKPGRICRPPMP